MGKQVSSVWIVTNNGALCSAHGTKDKVVGELRRLSGDKKSPLLPDSEYLLGIRGVGHFRGKKLTIQ